jgi:ribonuclease HI
MQRLSLFTDGSVNIQTRVGYGAYLLSSLEHSPLKELQKQIKVQRFEQTSSTQLELQTLLWALNEINTRACVKDITLTVYTDSQNIIGLPQRRASLERNDYYSSKNKRLSHYLLYQALYRLTDNIKCDFVKVAGHQPSRDKDEIAQRFALVDKAARRSLREAFR